MTQGRPIDREQAEKTETDTSDTLAATAQKAESGSADAQLLQFPTLNTAANPLLAIRSEVAEMETELQSLAQRMEETLDEQAKLLSDLQSKQTRLSDAFVATQEPIMAQGFRIDSLTKATRQRIQELQARLGDAGTQMQDQQQLLNKLTHQLNLQVETSRSLGGHVDSLQGEFNRAQETTRLRFGWLTGGLAAVVILGTAAATYFQLNPVAVPPEVESKLAALSVAGAQTETRLSGFDTSIQWVDNSLTGLKGQVASLMGFQEEVAGSVGDLQTQIGEVNTRMDDLAFRIEGPGISGGTLSEPLLPINGTDWRASQPPGNYTVQLVGVYQMQDLVRYVNRHSEALAGQPLSFNQGQLAGRDWFNLFHGSYATLDEAQAAIANLPVRLQGNGAYARTFASL
ncbi:SPOR domain-containing protein [Allohahella marinimesophila]|uniref:SPOR domain-containing protein n=1 Tax=Allohahella marinimesophila TaxID=1054972 RepID=A0ABP7NG01_9GAMM